MKLFILGDPHMRPDDSAVWHRVVEDVNAEQPDGVLVLGDLTGGPWTGTKEGTLKAVEILNGCQAPWESIIGNHDLESKTYEKDEDAVAMMLQALGRAEPAFHRSFGPLEVIGLSNTHWRGNEVCKNEIVIDEQQLSWFRSKLEELKDRPVLVLCHAPPIGSGLMVMTELHARVGNAYVNQNHNPGGMQQILWENPNVLFWFSGHNHLGQHYRDALSSRLGVLFVHTATASLHSSRDGYRQSRVLEVSDEGVRVRTFDHGLRKYEEELDYFEPLSLGALMERRRRMVGKRFVPMNPRVMEQGRGAWERPVGARRYLFLSDAHVVEKIGAVQQRLIEWCRRELRAFDPDRVILGGDLTHHASPCQASAFLDRLAIHGVPIDYIVGNNEGRDFQLEPKYAEAIPVVRLCCALESEQNVFLLETPDTERAEEAVKALLQKAPEGEPCLVFAHFTPDLIGEALENRLAERTAPLYWISGHRHRSYGYEKGNLKVRVCGGLDPIKVRGGMPELLVLDWDGRQARIEPVTVPKRVLASRNPRSFPLGIAYEGSAVEHVETALEYGATAIQFHYKFTKGIPTVEEREAVACFRDKVSGSFLSLHLPNLANPQERMDPEQLEPWLEWGEAIGVDDYTLHLPKVMVSQLFGEDKAVRSSEWASHCLDVYATIAKRILARGAQLSLENHYQKTRPADHEELLSSRPWHMTGMIDLVRAELIKSGVSEKDAQRVGMIFDSGHAFTDAKVSKIHGLGDWMERVGPYLQLAHIHQVKLNPETNKSQNHRGISARYGPMINYHGFLMNLNECTAHTFPLLIEVRLKDEAIESLKTLQDFYAEIM